MKKTVSYQASMGHIENKELVESLIGSIRENLEYFFESLRLEELMTCVVDLAGCRGTIFLTGVGKSGIIAKKIASTLISCGTKAAFLPPLDALHGDLGQIEAEDCVIFLSKSGETDELLQLTASVRNKGAMLFAVVSCLDSRLAKACDRVVCLPVSKELCPYDLAPTTSPLVQLIFGDVLAIALMRIKQFSVEDFAKNHPAGRLGKRLTLRVSDLMLRGSAIPTAYATDALHDVLVELSNKKCGCVFIQDDAHKLLGIFTDGDLRRALQQYGASVLEMKMQQLMKPHPRTVVPHALAFDAMKQMEQDAQKPITVLAVVDNECLVGVLRMHDIVQSGI